MIRDRERLVRRQRVRAFDQSTYMATAEDMIVTKLRWASLAHRAKDVDDARNMIAVRGADLDWGYLTRWCARHAAAARRAPPIDSSDVMTVCGEGELIETCLLPGQHAKDVRVTETEGSPCAIPESG